MKKYFVSVLAIFLVVSFAFAQAGEPQPGFWSRFFKAFSSSTPVGEQPAAVSSSISGSSGSLSGSASTGAAPLLLNPTVSVGTISTASATAGCKAGQQLPIGQPNDLVFCYDPNNDGTGVWRQTSYLGGLLKFDGKNGFGIGTNPFPEMALSVYNPNPNNNSSIYAYNPNSGSYGLQSVAPNGVGITASGGMKGIEGRGPTGVSGFGGFGEPTGIGVFGQGLVGLQALSGIGSTSIVPGEGVAVLAEQNNINGYGILQKGVAGTKNYFSSNVGIGTNNPGAKLDVLGNVKISDGTQGAGKVLTSDASGLASWQTLSGGGSGSFWADAGGGNIKNTNSGKVGIGTLNPADKLDVSGTVRISGAGNRLDFYNNSTSRTQTIAPGSATDNNFYIRNQTNNALILGTNGVENLRVAPGGNVGLGTQTPTERLDLGGGNIKMGYETINNTLSNQSGVMAGCSSGKNIIGGGCIYGGTGDFYLVQNGPNFDFAVDAWQCTWRAGQLGQVPNWVRATAICANIR